MGGLVKTYHHYEGSQCVARYPIEHQRDGVYLMGPITIVRDKDGNPVMVDRTVERDGQPCTEQMPKWDESRANQICAGPFNSEQDAVTQLRRKLAPKRPKITVNIPGQNAFEKWKQRNEPQPEGDEAA